MAEADFKPIHVKLPPGPWTCATCGVPVHDTPCVVLTGDMEDRRHDDAEHVWCSRECAWTQHPAHITVEMAADKRAAKRTKP